MLCFCVLQNIEYFHTCYTGYCILFIHMWCHFLIGCLRFSFPVILMFGWLRCKHCNVVAWHLCSYSGVRLLWSNKLQHSWLNLQCILYYTYWGVCVLWNCNCAVSSVLTFAHSMTVSSHVMFGCREAEAHFAQFLVELHFYLTLCCRFVKILPLL